MDTQLRSASDRRRSTSARSSFLGVLQGVAIIATPAAPDGSQGDHTTQAGHGLSGEDGGEEKPERGEVDCDEGDTGLEGGHEVCFRLGAWVLSVVEHGERRVYGGGERLTLHVVVQEIVFAAVLDGDVLHHTSD